jgi:hypothetical protein
MSRPAVFGAFGPFDVDFDPFEDDDDIDVLVEFGRCGPPGRITVGAGGRRSGGMLPASRRRWSSQQWGCSHGGL